MRVLRCDPTYRFATAAWRKLSSESASKVTKEVAKDGPGWWKSPEFWGGAGAIAGWGMTGAAIYDGQKNGPEKISLTMTPVLIVYSSLFARWAMVVKPQNLMLAACHVSNVCAQLYQAKRAIDHMNSTGSSLALLGSMREWETRRVQNAARRESTAPGESLRYRKAGGTHKIC